MRDALSLLDQAIAYGAGAVRETDVADMLGGADQPSIVHLLNSIAAGDGEALLEGARELRERLADPANVLAELASALQRLALIQVVGAGVVDEDHEPGLLAPLAETLPADQVQLLYEIAIQGRGALPMAPDPGVGLEMTLLRMLAFRPDAPVKHVVSAGSAAPPAKAAAPPGPPPDAARTRSQKAAERSGSAGSAARPPPPAALRGAHQTQPPPEAEREPSALPAADAARETSAPEPSPPPAAKSALDAGGWPETVRDLGLQGLSGELAAHSELVGAANGCLRLRLDGQHENLLTEDVRKELRAVLISALPSFSEVEIEIAGAGQGGTLAGRDRAAERRRQQRAEKEFREDPFVQASLEIFGSDVEIGSIRPIDDAGTTSSP